MEVHTHPHTPRKKFTHYLWEFLMLFLAVFCGFMAENFREHLIEHQREREYMHSLVEDLQTDTLKLSDEILLGKDVSGRIKNLVSFLDNNVLPKDSVEKLYQLNLRAGRVVRLDFEDRTSSQLKNGGNMRLIRNKKVADSIRNYWGIIKVMENISDRLEMLRGKTADISVQLFYSKYVKFWNELDPLRSEVSVLPGAKLITDDPKLLAEYSNRGHSILIVLNNYIVNMQMTKAAAAKLIELIRTEYNIN